MVEYRVFGPPGTGKTTYLTAQIERALGKYFPNDILVASFTRAGAYTVAARTTQLPRENIGTLHAFCYRALNQPDIAEAHIAEFNQLHPEYAIGYEEQKGDIDDPFAVVDTKNTSMLVYQTMRAKMIPRNEWPIEVQQFADAWEGWIDNAGYTDLTGLIEAGIESVDYAPGNPRVGFFDEAQDFTRLEMRLVDKWSQEMDMVIKVGDDDQMIYSFKGATTDSFNGDIAPEYKIYLKESWRLPQQIVEYSAKWISQIEGREPKPYFSNRHDGFVTKILANYKMPAQLITEIQRLNETGHTTMVITSCGYMLDNVKAAMFDAGVAWCNPYKPKRGDWNPLLLNRGRGVSSLQRLVDYMTIPADSEYNMMEHPLYGFESIPAWTNEQLANIIELFDVKKLGLRRGAKTNIKKLKSGEMTFHEWCSRYMPEDYSASETIIGNLLFPDLEWAAENLYDEKAKSLKLALNIIRKGGLEGLKERPLNIIGTIHSVKGGEADYVFLCPDVSKETMKSTWAHGDDKDSVTRLFYVGMTRARFGLYLMQPATYQRVEFPEP